ncbi:MAG: hypothetical protein JJU29_23265 [Verrucomicrobia bacterium]|nr:hypothetical protein [Verrucomicrobiota bacterium]MCH8514341.1 DUF6259 domain-containing protein [Kiritimatiellia bacterium]
MSATLENEFLKIDFDEQTGAIKGLFNKKTQWHLIRQPALSRGIRLLVPTESNRNNKATHPFQQLSDLQKIGSDTCVLLWETITANHSGPLDIRVEMRVKLFGNTIEFIMTVHNQSPYPVEEVWGPCLGGIREPLGTRPIKALTVNQIAGLHEQVLGDGFHSWGYFGVDHPTTMTTFPGTNCQLPFMLLSHENQGLYLGMHGNGLDLVSFVNELVPGYANSCHAKVPKGDEIGGQPAGFVTSVAQLPFILPGEKRELSPILMGLYEGTWHRGIAFYRDWRKTWFAKKPQPKWLEEVDCWMTLQMNSSEGCCLYRYTDLPDMMRKAKADGAQALQLIGWAIGGQDGREPFQDTDELLGTREELKTAIAEIERMGIRVLLMCKFKWADQTDERFETQLLPHTLKDMHGNPTHFAGYGYQTLTQFLTGGSRRSGAGLCHSSAAYRKWALKEFDKIVDLKPSGILYDELSSDLLVCFDPTHGHPPGESHQKGTLKMAEEFYERARETHPDFLFAGEGVLDPIAQIFSVNYIRTSRGTWGGPHYTPAWKYMDSDMKFATCIIGYDDREMINQCLVQGHIINYEARNFKANTDEIPMTVAYGRKALRLRRRLWDYLWNGTYLDTVDARVECETKGAEILYAVFKNKRNGGKAYVLANQSETPAEVNLVTSNKCQNFTVYEMESDGTRTSEGSMTIPPRSLVVMVETPVPS